MATKKPIPLAVWLPLGLVATVISLIGSLVVYSLLNPPAPPTVNFVGIITVRGQTITPQQLGQGQQLYELHCAVCHGLKLEGQPNWQEGMAANLLLAPALDQNSPSRQYSDEQILQLISQGGIKPNTTMLGYKDKLTPTEMAALLGYIKTHWK